MGRQPTADLPADGTRVTGDFVLVKEPVIKVCFVCLGNICRSPTAEAVFRHLVEQEGLGDHIVIDSAGTGAWHAGEPPDNRARAAGRRRGIRVEGRARQLKPADLERFDYLLAMDKENLQAMQEMARNEAQRAKTSLLRDFDASAAPHADVPDPYYGGQRGFDEVLDLCAKACGGLLACIREKHGL